MENQIVVDAIRNIAQYSGNFMDAAAAARLAAPLCKLDAGGNVVPTDARSSLQSVLARIAAEHPEVAKAAPQTPARGNMVNDPAIITLMAEDANERKSLDVLRGLYGKGSNGERANALMKSNPAEYRRLRQLAVAANLL